MTFYTKESISAALICFISVLIWFEYISVFREKDVYWILTTNFETKEITASPCLGEACYMNGAYDFKMLAVREGMGQFATTETRNEFIKKELKHWIDEW